MKEASPCQLESTMLKSGVMFQKYFLSILLFIVIFHLSLCCLYAQEGGKFITIRLFSQGGFFDDRSPIGKLGGGQLALDVKPTELPIAISFFGEYYTNSPQPTHSYEIADITGVNLLLITQLESKTTIFLGVGSGELEVPEYGNEFEDVEDVDDDADIPMEKGTFYDLETGINFWTFKYVGFYGIYKYLYAQKEVDGVKVIDFNEHIVLLGVTLNFSL